MGCLKLTYYQTPELRIISNRKELTSNKSVLNERRAYLYGFNGMEKDDEIKSSGNSYDFGARIYDPRIGRWLARDPQSDRYTSLSPYNFVANSPLIAIDPNGEEIVVIGTAEYRLGVIKALHKLGNTEAGMKILEAAINSPNTLVIQLGVGGNEVYGHLSNDDGTFKEYLDLDINDLTETYEDGSKKTSETLLGHELTHFLDNESSVRIPYNIVDEENFETGETYSMTKTFSSSEVKAVDAGNQIRATYGMKLRSTYGGQTVLNKDVSSIKGKFSIGGKTSYSSYNLLRDSDKKFDTGIYKGKFVDSRSKTKFWQGVSSSFVRPIDYKNDRTYKNESTKGTNTKAIKFKKK